MFARPHAWSRTLSTVFFFIGRVSSSSLEYSTSVEQTDSITISISMRNITLYPPRIPLLSHEVIEYAVVQHVPCYFSHISFYPNFVYQIKSECFLTIFFIPSPYLYWIPSYRHDSAFLLHTDSWKYPITPISGTITSNIVKFCYFATAAGIIGKFHFIIFCFQFRSFFNSTTKGAWVDVYCWTVSPRLYL